MSAKIRQNQLSLDSCGYRLERVRIDNLSDVVFFDDVKNGIVFGALIGNGTDFSHPVVIPNLCACPVEEYM